MRRNSESHHHGNWLRRKPRRQRLYHHCPNKWHTHTNTHSEVTFSLGLNTTSVSLLSWRDSRHFLLLAFYDTRWEFIKKVDVYKVTCVHQKNKLAVPISYFVVSSSSFTFHCCTSTPTWQKLSLNDQKRIHINFNYWKWSYNDYINDWVVSDRVVNKVTHGSPFCKVNVPKQTHLVRNALRLQHDKVSLTEAKTLVKNM